MKLIAKIATTIDQGMKEIATTTEKIKMRLHAENITEHTNGKIVPKIGETKTVATAIMETLLKVRTLLCKIPIQIDDPEEKSRVQKANDLPMNLPWSDLKVMMELTTNQLAAATNHTVN